MTSKREREVVHVAEQGRDVKNFRTQGGEVKKN
jgi:hypothetical protein